MNLTDQTYSSLVGNPLLPEANAPTVRKLENIKTRCLNETKTTYTEHHHHSHHHHTPSGSFLYSATHFPLSTGPTSAHFPFPTTGPTAGPTDPSAGPRPSYYSNATPLYPNSTTDPYATLPIGTATGTAGPLSYSDSGPYANTMPTSLFVDPTLTIRSVIPIPSTAALPTGSGFYGTRTGTGSAGGIAYSTASAPYGNGTSATPLPTGSGPFGSGTGTGIAASSTAGPTAAENTTSATVDPGTNTTSTTVQLRTGVSTSPTAPLGTGASGTGPTAVRSTLFTTFTSTVAPSFVTTWTKSVPSEYFWHHHRPHHTVSKVCGSGLSCDVAFGVGGRTLKRNANSMFWSAVPRSRGLWPLPRWRRLR